MANTSKKLECFSNYTSKTVQLFKIQFAILDLVDLVKFEPQDVELIPEVLRQDDGEEKDDKSEQGEEVAHVLHNSNPKNEKKLG